MLIPARHPQEDERLEALYRYDLLDTPAEAVYNDLAVILTGICDVPMSAISLIDSQRQWLKAQVGMPLQETPRDCSFCAHAILEPKELMVVEDARKDPRFEDNPWVTGPMQVRFYAGAPLLTPQGLPLGAVCALDTQPRQLSPMQRDALASLSRQVTRVLEQRLVMRQLQHHMHERQWYEHHLAHEHERLKTENARLSARADCDSLTGLPNRHAFHEAMKNALRQPTPTSLVVLDIDHFKRINDTWGHPMGDQVLQALAHTLQAQVPSPMTLARIGGEEFVVVAPDTSLNDATALAEALRNQVQITPMPQPITISLGVAQARSPEETGGDLYTRADAALYQAKNSGRNRVVATA